MLPFGVTITATVPQRSEIPEGLMNYAVLKVDNVSIILVGTECVLCEVWSEEKKQFL